MKYFAPKIFERTLAMGISFSKLRPIEYTCYELAHTWHPSCTHCSVEIGGSVFKEALKIYSSVYVVEDFCSHCAKDKYC